ncbi:MAG TPA: long-chain fatty acid--CoA ligase, partial [Deltaproteobacteria bacterium]|nr:long-chain fatty acid--CoA ligase [Deltaproteobacteria bacterium]
FHTFSVSANMLSMIRYGGTIYLMNKLDFKELHYALTEGGVSCISGVPTLFYALTHHPELQDIDYRSMRGLISGGSALPIEVYKEFKNRFNADIHQGYGLTEASPVCTVNNIHVKLKPESIGPTVPGVEARVVDDEGKVLTSNQVGELEFKGPNVMKGYFNRPNETSEVMHDGWLKTGDLGYMDEEGYLYMTGYKKLMIITSGFNVYNKEVEDVLNSYPGVRDSAITGEPDLIRGAIVKAFIVKDDPGISENDIKRFARERLAPYKSPRKIVFVKSIPRDNMGKIILDEIKEPDQP